MGLGITRDRGTLTGRLKGMPITIAYGRLRSPALLLQALSAVSSTGPKTRLTLRQVMWSNRRSKFRKPVISAPRTKRTIHQ
jgi:hypothetical protein